MHSKRIITALIAIPLIYLYITRLPPPFFLILLMIIGVLAQIEFYRMYKTKRVFIFLGVICCILFLGSTFLIDAGILEGGILNLHITILVLSFIMISSARLFVIKDPSDSLKDISSAIVGLIYIPPLLLMQWYLMLKGVEWILFLYACVWSSDTFAYYIGKGIGRRRLYESVSPNKTLEGAFGSVVGGILSGGLMGLILFKDIDFYVFLIFGGIVGFVAIVGDLIESMFKRDAGIKDSGFLIPGHGGVLDRIDSALLAGVVLYWLVLIL